MCDVAYDRCKCTVWAQCRFAHN